MSWQIVGAEDLGVTEDHGIGKWAPSNPLNFLENRHRPVILYILRTLI